MSDHDEKAPNAAEMRKLYEKIFNIPASKPTTEPAPNAPIVHFTRDTLPAGEPVRLETPNEELRRHGHLEIPPTSPEDTQPITPLFVEDDK